jgi:hypothetical protein
MCAACCGIARIDCTRVVVIAVGGRAADADAVGTAVIRRAGVLIVTGQAILDGLRTADPGVWRADILEAGTVRRSVTRDHGDRIDLAAERKGVLVAD